MSFSEARDYVNEIEDARERVDKAIGAITRKSTESWQRRAIEWTGEAIERLGSDEGKEALAYLLSRGLIEDTIKKARLGYARCKHPETKRSVPCIVIPWYAGEKIVKVQCRDIRPDVPHDERYFMLPGSSNDGLYLMDSLNLKRAATVVVEGEFDALIAAQECGDIASVVATGSTTGGQSFRNVARLASRSLVLVAFDNEGKGESAALWWLDRLDNAIRYRPLAHDVNDMHLTGYDVRSWIDAVVELESEQEEDDADDTDDADLLSVCSVCGAEVEHYAEDGKPYCSEHYCVPCSASQLTRDEIRERFASALPGWSIQIEPVGAHRLNTVTPGNKQPTSADYWREVALNVARPPKDHHGIPYYTVAKWKQKLAELRAYIPYERFSHYPGGYEGYCKKFRRDG
jgi:hypothetical protein